MAQPTSSGAPSSVSAQQSASSSVNSGAIPPNPNPNSNSANTNLASTPRIQHITSSSMNGGQRDETDGQGSTTMSSASASVSASASQPFDWDGDKMLHLYMREYLLKRNFTKTAQMLTGEASIQDDIRPPAKAPQGLLFEWWVIFWDLYHAKTGEGTGGSQNAYLYHQALKPHQAPLSQLPGSAPRPPFAFHPPPRSLHLPGAQQPTHSGGPPPQPGTIYSSLQHYAMLGHTQDPSQQPGIMGRPGPGPFMGPGGRPGMSLQPGQNPVPPSHPSQPPGAQQHPSAPGQPSWQQQQQQQQAQQQAQRQGQPSQQQPQGPPSMQSVNHPQSQQQPTPTPGMNGVHPGMTPQMRANHDMAQHQHAINLRLQAVGANGGAPPQSGPAGMIRRPPMSEYNNPNTASSPPNGIPNGVGMGVNGNAPPAPPGAPSGGPGLQPQHTGPSPYQTHPVPYALQHPQQQQQQPQQGQPQQQQSQNPNQLYTPSMPPPPFPGQQQPQPPQPAMNQQQQQQQAASRMQQGSMPPTPSSAAEQLAGTSQQQQQQPGQQQQTPSGTPRPQQPQTLPLSSPFAFQQPPPSTNPTLPLQQQQHPPQQLRPPFEPANPNGPIVRSGMPMQPPAGALRGGMGMNATGQMGMGGISGPRYANLPQQQQPESQQVFNGGGVNGPSPSTQQQQQQQPNGPSGPLGSVAFGGPMGTGGILPSSAAAAAAGGNPPFTNFMTPQQQHQHLQLQLQQQQYQQQQQQLYSSQQQQQQGASSSGNGASRAPTPAQQQSGQQSGPSQQRSQTSTPAPNASKGPPGSNQTSPNGPPGGPRPGAGPGPGPAPGSMPIAQPAPAAQYEVLQSLLPSNRPNPLAHQQQQAFLATQQRGVPGPGPPRIPSNSHIPGMDPRGGGPFTPGPPQMHMQQLQGGQQQQQQQMSAEEAHAGMKRAGSPSNENGDRADSSPPDPKRVRRNSQQLGGDGVTPGQAGVMQNGAPRGPTPYGGDGNNGQQGSAIATQQMLQLRGARGPPQFGSGPPLQGVNSPQLGGGPPPLNTLSEHAPAQMAAAAVAKGINNNNSITNNGVRPGGMPGNQQPASANGAFMPAALTRLQQGAANPAGRSGPPSPPLGGGAQKGSMPPPSHTLTPSPLGKDLGKGPQGDSAGINGNRGPSSTPKPGEQKPPTPAPGSSTFPHSTISSAAGGGDPADDSSPSLSRPSPSTSGGGSTSTNNPGLGSLTNFNQMTPYDSNSLYMSSGVNDFGASDFDVQEMFNSATFGNSSDMNAAFMFDDLFVEKAFDQSNDDFSNSIGHFS